MNTKILANFQVYISVPLTIIYFTQTYFSYSMIFWKLLLTYRPSTLLKKVFITDAFTLDRSSRSQIFDTRLVSRKLRKLTGKYFYLNKVILLKRDWLLVSILRNICSSFLQHTFRRPPVWISLNLKSNHLPNTYGRMLVVLWRGQLRTSVKIKLNSLLW